MSEEKAADQPRDEQGRYRIRTDAEDAVRRGKEKDEALADAARRLNGGTAR